MVKSNDVVIIVLMAALIGIMTGAWAMHAGKSADIAISQQTRESCTREHDLVKVTLETARSLSRHHADSEPFQYKAAGQMGTMFRVCFADPDHESPESPGLLAATLGDLTEDEIAHVEKVLDDGWAKSTIGQPWRGEVR